MTEKAKKSGKNKWFYWIIAVLFLLLVGVAIVGRDWLLPQKETKDAFTRIRERGYLIALTDKNSLNYFIDHGNPEGYQLDLLESFADFLGVPLKIIVSNDVSKLFYYLDLNAGDVIALNNPVTRDGRKLVHFASPLGETRMVLVQRRLHKSKAGNKVIQGIDDFSGDTVFYRKNIFVDPLLSAINKRVGDRIVFCSETEKNSMELIKMVSEAKLEYAICEENLAMVAKRYYRNIDASLVLTDRIPYAWGTAHASDSLLMNINDWLLSMNKKELKKIYLNYYDNPGSVHQFTCDYCSFNGMKLSPYDDAIKSAGKMIRWDWRLLASLVYQESNFRQGQVSSRNATGLMQLMPDIAKKYGVDSISSAAHQIMAGAKYVKYLESQLPDNISNPMERIYFTLASYNVGPGKIMKARERAEKNGLNPNKWNDNVDYYLTRRSKKNPNAASDTLYDTSLYGMEGGFVHDIMTRYMHYRNIIPE
jgi:membrane-bound lytic murein transglycosylase F